MSRTLPVHNPNINNQLSESRIMITDSKFTSNAYYIDLKKIHDLERDNNARIHDKSVILMWSDKNLQGHIRDEYDPE